MRLIALDKLANDSVLAHTQAGRYVLDCSDAIDNLKTRLFVLDTGQLTVPVTVNDHTAAESQSYVSSPFNTYIRYGRAELAMFRHAWWRRPLDALAGQLAGYFDRSEFDRTVFVNNWLLSTNLYPEDWRGEGLADLTRMLRERFPSHALGFRSLNPYSNWALMQALLNNGYVAVPSRQVYLFEGGAGSLASFLRHRNQVNDRRLWKHQHYHCVDGTALHEKDMECLAHLYQMLYIEKYSRLNPHYNAHYLRRGVQSGWLRIKALRTECGRIDGVVGWISNASTLTVPIVGYDTTLPQTLGLYRRLTHLCINEAIERRCLLNFSSGAAEFKRLRGGQAMIEYTMVMLDHLPAKQRTAWMRLTTLLQSLVVPIMRRYQL